MSSFGSPAFSSPRRVQADPDQIPPVGVEPGGTLVFLNSSPDFPEFEIQFIDVNPASPGDVLTGTHEVTIHFTRTGTFRYQIKHIAKAGGENKISGIFSVRSCSGC